MWEPHLTSLWPCYSIPKLCRDGTSVHPVGGGMFCCQFTRQTVKAVHENVLKMKRWSLCMDICEIKEMTTFGTVIRFDSHCFLHGCPFNLTFFGHILEVLLCISECSWS